MHGHAYCFLWTERTRPLAVNQNSGMIENNLQNIISTPLPSPQKERKMTMAAVNYCLTENSVDFLSQKKKFLFFIKRMSNQKQLYSDVSISSCFNEGGKKSEKFKSNFICHQAMNSSYGMTGL